MDYTTIRIRPGCTVKLKKIGSDAVVEYEVIRAVHDPTGLSGNALSYDISNNTLSDESPLGNALIGKKSGETVRGYEILEIKKTNKMVENVSDEMEQILLEKRDYLLDLKHKLENGTELDAIILSCNRYLYPQKSDVVINEDFYQIESGENLLKSISVTNISMEDTGFFRLNMELFDAGSNNPCSVNVEAIINADVFKAIKIPYGRKISGYYSYDYADDVIELRSARIRIDQKSKGFIFRNNPFGISYLFHIELT